MNGAAKRREHERAMVWYAANLPNLKKPISLVDFVAPKHKAKLNVQRWSEAWDKADRAMAAYKKRSNPA